MTPGRGLMRTPLPQGFSTSGLNCGVRRYRPDLGLIVSELACTTVGVFTQNTLAAAPIDYCRKLLPSSETRALITNSGQANAATGEQGKVDNMRMAQAVAKSLGIRSSSVLTASTGVIGQPLEIEKIESSVSELVGRLQNSSADPFALAILTTDLVPKTVTTEVPLSQGMVRLTGICKGSGMIHPNMATMLGYLLTDVRLNEKQASKLLTKAVDQSFNMISVDGETSTNDAVFLMANGARSIDLQTTEDEELFTEKLLEICCFLAKCIARDGEGATKLVEVNIQGHPDIALARRLAKSLVLSPLVKTAVHGEDPNWGRIMARLGMEGLTPEILAKLQLTLQGHTLYVRGQPVEVDSKALKDRLRQDEVNITITFPFHGSKVTAWGCDLSKRYVEINAEYTT